MAVLASARAASGRPRSSSHPILADRPALAQFKHGCVDRKALVGTPGSRRMDADVAATVRAAFPDREVASADVVGPS